MAAEKIMKILTPRKAKLRQCSKKYAYSSNLHSNFVQQAYEDKTSASLSWARSENFRSNRYLFPLSYVWWQVLGGETDAKVVRERENGSRSCDVNWSKRKVFGFVIFSCLYNYSAEAYYLFREAAVEKHYQLFIIQIYNWLLLLRILSTLSSTFWRMYHRKCETTRYSPSKSLMIF
jgi:hypothetical protein